MLRCVHIIHPQKSGERPSFASAACSKPVLAELRKALAGDDALGLVMAARTGNLAAVEVLIESGACSGRDAIEGAMSPLAEAIAHVHDPAIVMVAGARDASALSRC
ncbi:MAG: hypothetical protein R3D67_14535 [Hyphomicrobiaceae bacterium]